MLKVVVGNKVCSEARLVAALDLDLTQFCFHVTTLLKTEGFPEWRRIERGNSPQSANIISLGQKLAIG